MADTERSLALLDTVRRSGVLSETSMQALKKVDPARKLTLGEPANQHKEENVLLVATLVDDSGSLNVAVERDPKTERRTSRSASCDDPKSNAEAVRIGHNAVIQALQESAKPSTIWFHTRYLKGYELNSWNQLERVTRMDRSNFRPDGGTPLYDETVAILGSVITKTQEFRNHWVQVRTATLIVTDGEDTESRLQTPTSVKNVVIDMYNMGIHIIVAMGIDDGKTDFRKVFIEMGIHENLILTPGNTPDEIRKAFGLFGKMASRAIDPRRFNNMLTGGFLALPKGGS